MWSRWLKEPNPGSHSRKHFNTHVYLKRKKKGDCNVPLFRRVKATSAMTGEGQKSEALEDGKGQGEGFLFIMTDSRTIWTLKHTVKFLFREKLN